MFDLRKSDGTVGAYLWIDPAEVEASAMKQIANVMEHPRLFRHVAIMPDVHAGIGATIGSVIPLKRAMCPSAVGVDIGCGMLAYRLGYYDEFSPEKLTEIRDRILERIPVGFAHRQNSQKADVAKYLTISQNIVQEWCDDFGLNFHEIYPQLGTLGGGNHFIEIQKDRTGHYWAMIHSGSRNFGFTLANKFIDYTSSLANAPSGLEYLDEDDEQAAKYKTAVNYATAFAYHNRVIMSAIVASIVYDVMGLPQKSNASLNGFINIHHNFVREELHYGRFVYVHRKGATYIGNTLNHDKPQLGIIPGSMGTCSYIVKAAARISPELALSYYSCSHGAGRKMSRSKAKQTITEEMLTTSMNGIIGNTSVRHLDEAPMAYKDIDFVIRAQSGLLRVVHKLTPVLNIKG